MSDKFVLVVTECRDKNTTFRLLGRKSLDEKWVRQSSKSRLKETTKCLWSIQTGRLRDKDGEDWIFNCVAVNEQVSVFGGNGIIRVVDNNNKKEVSWVLT